MRFAVEWQYFVTASHIVRINDAKINPLSPADTVCSIVHLIWKSLLDLTKMRNFEPYK